MRRMSVPLWVCLDCMAEFYPENDMESFSFKCPNCKSDNTVPNRLESQVSHLLYEESIEFAYEENVDSAY